MIEPLLLPSQEDLVERLRHNICYAEQLQLLCAESGAGKSFLLKQLKRSIDDSSVVFISCPLHADDAEIRRKLLLPLLSEPVFDDEVSLSDALIQFVGSLEQPISILIDDAERLSMVLWAELMALTQMTVSGKLISVVAAVTPEFEQTIFESLPDSYQTLLSSLYIEPLIQQEQDALYYSLLSQSDGFENHRIAKPDFTGSTVYPRDIITAFASPDGEQAEKVIRTTNFKAMLLALPIITLVLLLTWFYQEKILNYVFDDDNAVKTAATVTASKSIELPVKDAAEVFKVTESKKPEPEVIDETQKSPNSQPSNAEASGTETKLVTPQVVAQANIEDATEESVAVAAESELTLPKLEVSITKPVDEPVTHVATVKVSKNVIAAKTKSAVVEKPEVKRPNPNFYTLQLATVSKKRSLNNLVKQLKQHPGLKVGKRQDRWVVLIGEFEHYRQAKAFEQKLVKETKLPKPWIRKWKALKDVKLQNLNKSSEN